MMIEEAAKRPPAGYIEHETSRHTPPEPGSIYRAWIPTRAKQSNEPGSQIAIVRVEQISHERTGDVVILTAPDGSKIFRPFKTEAVPLRGAEWSSWHPVSVFVPVETPPKVTK